MNEFDDSTPLHSMPLKPWQYWACEQPERPPTSHVTIFEERCRACVIALQAAFENDVFGHVRVLDPMSGEPTGDVRYDDAEFRIKHGL